MISKHINGWDMPKAFTKTANTYMEFMNSESVLLEILSKVKIKHSAWHYTLPLGCCSNKTGSRNLTSSNGLGYLDNEQLHQERGEVGFHKT